MVSGPKVAKVLLEIQLLGRKDMRWSGHKELRFVDPKELAVLEHKEFKAKAGPTGAVVELGPWVGLGLKAPKVLLVFRSQVHKDLL